MYCSVLLSTLLALTASVNAGWEDWEGSSSTSTVPAATPSPATAAAQQSEVVVQIVSVSDNNGSLKYFPESIQAAPGSVVQFQFHPKNHTITESSFAEPCKPLAANLTSETRPGIRSGFVPVSGTEEMMPVYNVLINDTKPIWLYCGQVNHCQKGMVMVINQNTSSTEKTVEIYKQKAMELPPAGASQPAYSMPVATPSTLATSAPAVATTNNALPPPTTVTGQAGSATATAPSIFTGAASKHDILGVPAVAGMFLGGVFALL